MFAEFARLFFEEAVNAGFSPSGTHDVISGEAIAEFTPMLMFQRLTGQDLCVVRLINTRIVQAAQYTEERSGFIHSLSQSIEQSNVARAFLIDLPAGDTITQDYLDAVYGGEEFMEQRVYIVCWGLSLANREIISDVRQPTDIAGVPGIVGGAFARLGGASEAPPLRHVVDVFRQRVNVPVITYTIIAINAAVLALVYAAGGPDRDILLFFGALEPGRVFRDGEYYRMFTSMWLHSGVLHFMSNALGLYIFGARLERRLGRVRFVFIYLLSGLFGSVVSLIYLRGVAVGASGGIYGLMGAALAYAAISRRSLDGLPLYALALFALIGVAFGLMDPTVGNAAHIGGFVAGLASGYAICVLMKRSAK